MDSIYCGNIGAPVYKMDKQVLKQSIKRPNGWAWDWTPPTHINGVEVDEYFGGK